MSSIGDRPEFAARSTDFEVITEDDMLIRITRRDKTFNATQVVKIHGLARLCQIIQRRVMRLGKQHPASYADQSNYC
jgi:hypothetical protein